MAALRPAGPPESLRGKAFHVIFEHDAGWARHFDAILIVLILASVDDARRARNQGGRRLARRRGHDEKQRVVARLRGGA